MNMEMATVEKFRGSYLVTSVDDMCIKVNAKQVETIANESEEDSKEKIAILLATIKAGRIISLSKEARKLERDAKYAVAESRETSIEFMRDFGLKLEKPDAETMYYKEGMRYKKIDDEHKVRGIVQLLRYYDIETLNSIFEELRYYEIKDVLESDCPVATLSNML